MAVETVFQCDIAPGDCLEVYRGGHDSWWFRIVSRTERDVAVRLSPEDVKRLRKLLKGK